MLALTYVAAAVATLPLVLILFHLLKQGAAFITPAFFTEMPKPVGEPGGGMSNAIVGTLILVGVASAFGPLSESAPASTWQRSAVCGSLMW